ncbi:hypothetical protein RI367_002050 [Sorochytrium milnesiophthora]
MLRAPTELESSGEDRNGDDAANASQPDSDAELTDQEEADDYAGYTLFTNDDDGDNEDDEDKEKVSSAPPPPQPLVIDLSDVPTDALLTKETVQSIQDIMRGIQIPDSAIPEWAKSLPEEMWLPQLKDDKTTDVLEER